MKYFFVIALGASIAYLIGYLAGWLKGKHETAKMKNQIENLKKFIDSNELGV